MSYIRSNHPLQWFKGESKEYVFLGSTLEGNNIIEDFDSNYDDDESFCELLGNIVEYYTGDAQYANKIVETLAKKLEISEKLRDHKLTAEEIIEEAEDDDDYEEQDKDLQYCTKCNHLRKHIDGKCTECELVSVN